MSTTHDPGKSVLTARRTPRYTKEDALSDRDYQLLLEGAGELENYYGQQARFAILVMGRLGLRRGELAHLRRKWVNPRTSMIEIPRYDPCDQGKGGLPCGDCRLKAEQVVEHNDGISFEEALAHRWEPKTVAAARSVPYAFDPRTDISMERFLDRYDGWPLSAQAINRRVKKAAKAAPEIDPDDVYPHALRATAASYYADRGLDVFSLTSLMGWVDLATAKHYIASSGERTARALYRVHNQ